jgi:hypothetical protein
MNMKEEQVVTKTKIEYSAVIFYCQHHTVPFPALIWIPRFADPISSNVSPYVRSWLNVIGTNMAAYLDQHNMPGLSTSRDSITGMRGLQIGPASFATISFFTETALYRYATPRFDTVDSDGPTLFAHGQGVDGTPGVSDCGHSGDSCWCAPAIRHHWVDASVADGSSCGYSYRIRWIKRSEL